MLNQIDLSRVDLNLLVLFEAVLAERHVGRAGERLSLSASAVSHGLGRLRRLLNEFRVPARLLAAGGSGERSLTDLLHLAELLQQASSLLDGELRLQRLGARQG